MPARPSPTQASQPAGHRARYPRCLRIDRSTAPRSPQQTRPGSSLNKSSTALLAPREDEGLRPVVGRPRPRRRLTNRQMVADHRTAPTPTATITGPPDAENESCLRRSSRSRGSGKGFLQTENRMTSAVHSCGFAKRGGSDYASAALVAPLLPVRGAVAPGPVPLCESGGSAALRTDVRRKIRTCPTLAPDR
jgi:hypothetical protein